MPFTLYFMYKGENTYRLIEVIKLSQHDKLYLYYHSLSLGGKNNGI
jgi:hypothetical protein